VNWHIISSMYISHITLKNWRNFTSINVDLGQRVFIAGPNASGKSNLLDAIGFIRDIAKPGGGLQKAVEERGGLTKLRCLAARRYPNVELDLKISELGTANEWTYGIGMRQESRGRRLPLLVYERVSKNGSNVIDRPDSSDKSDPLLLSQTFLEQISTNAKFRPLADFFENISYLHLVPQLVRHPEAFPGPGLPGDPYGKSFLERVAKTPERTKRARLNQIEKVLRVAVPQLKELSLVKDETGVPHLEAKYEHWRLKGAHQREDQFSDGTLRLLALFWSLLEGDSVLLLEEPELSLNPSIVKKLPALMSRLQKLRKRQIILSTHSPDLLSDASIGGEEVLLLTPSGEGTGVETASSDKAIRDLLEGGMTIADAVLPRTAPNNVNQLNQLEMFQ
jgi:predicted ATPase